MRVAPGVCRCSETSPMMGDAPSGVVAPRTCPSGVASFGRVTHAPADHRALCEAIRRSLLHQSRAAPREPQSGFPDGAGLGAGRVASCSSWTRLLTSLWSGFASWWPCSSWTRLLTCPRCRRLGSSSSWTRLLTCPLLCMSWFFVLKTVEVPPLQYLDKVVDVFFVQFIDGMDVPVIMERRVGVSPTVEVPQIQFIARVSGHSFKMGERGQPKPKLVSSLGRGVTTPPPKPKTSSRFGWKLVSAAGYVRLVGQELAQVSVSF